MSGLLGWLAEGGARAARAAAGKALDGGPGQEALARAVGLAQRSLEAVAAVQARAMKTAGLAARPDYQELTKRLARLKRKARALDRQLSGAAGEPSGGTGGDDENR